MYKQDQNGVLEVQDEVQRFRVMVGRSRKESNQRVSERDGGSDYYSEV